MRISYLSAGKGSVTRRSGPNLSNLTNVATFALFLIILTAFSIIIVQSEDGEPTLRWTNTYGPYLAYSVIQTSDGGFAVAGQNASYRPFSPHSPPDWQNYTALLIKVDEEGNVIWKKTYEAQVGYGTFSNSVTVVQTKDSGYLLSGDDWLLKLDAQGNTQWKKTFTTLEHCRAVQASDGGYALIGNTRIVDSSNSVNSILIKTDKNGDTLWSKTFSTGLPFREDVSASSLEETNDKGYAIAGSWHGSFWFAKTHANGNVDFNKTYNLISSGGAAFTSLSKTADEGYILAGFDYDPTMQTAYSAWIVKTDVRGNAEWDYHFVLPGFGALFRSTMQTADGGYIAVGNPALAKVDSSGTLRWNSSSYDAYSVSATQDGGFLVAGGLGDLLSSGQNIWVANFAPESTIPSDETSSISIVWIVIVVTMVAVAVVGFLVYLKKSKH